MGLDPEEVANFLRDIADQMEELIRERNALKEASRQKDIQLIEYKERDETLKATLATATKMCEQIRDDAEREAKLIIADASQKAEMVMRDGRDQLKRMYQEIADVKKLRMQFETNLRALCQSHMQMIESSHVSLPDPQINLAHAVSVTSPSHAQHAQQMHASAAPAPQVAQPQVQHGRFRNPLA
jgi:cell division initiation protein